MIGSIERKLFRINAISVSIVVFLPEDRPAVRISSYGGRDKFVYDFPSFLRLSLNRHDSRTWDKSNYINLNYIGKIQMISVMKNMIRMIASENVFGKDPELGSYITQNLNEDGRSKWILLEKIGENSIAIRPCIIQEDCEQYEGVTIVINSPENTANLTISEFIALVSSLEDINIWVLSQTLMASVGNAMIRDKPIDADDYNMVVDQLDKLTNKVVDRQQEGGMLNVESGSDENLECDEHVRVQGGSVRGSESET